MSLPPEPLALDGMLTDEERREKFPNTDRAKCIKAITASIGEGGFREFLRQPQPAFEDRTGAEILERDPEELLRRLHELDRSDLDDLDDVPTVFEDVSGVRHMRKSSEVNRLFTILDELEGGSH